MPEGDTVHRSAQRLDTWMAGREVTDAVCVRRRVDARSLVGDTIEGWSARGKHLLMPLASGRVLHTHLLMTGSWHRYRTGQRWERPEHEMRIMIEAGDHVAVGFLVPTIEILAPGEVETHPALVSLGPDVLDARYDPAESVRRARAVDPDEIIGVALLDQRVAAGVGNVYRCEALFLERIDPHARVRDLDDEALLRLFRRSARLIKPNVSDPLRDTGLPNGARWVYGRAGKGCRRCGSTIALDRTGEQRRVLHWCPKCQSSG